MSMDGAWHDRGPNSGANRGANNGGANKAADRSANIDAISQSIGRAHQHTQRALSEAVSAARALLDVASLSIGGTPAASYPPLKEIAQAFDQLAASLAGDADAAGSGPLRAVLEALEVQIATWEERSREDADARAVLRAFLGLREILWQLGLRPSPDPKARQRETRESPPRSKAGRSRVQRVDIQG